MGLFWGNDDVKATQPQVQKQEETDPRLKPLYVLSQVGGAAAGTEFGFLFRDMHEAVRNNNDMIVRMYRMVKQLVQENEEMRSRLETLEKQMQQNVDSSLSRAI